MSALGDIKTGKELGYKRGTAQKYILSACLVCGRQKWVQLIAGRPKFNYCQSCAAKKAGRGGGTKANNWRGGRHKNYHGYITIWLPPDSFFYSMTTRGGIVLEHRLIMAKHLGRWLHSWEIIHHRNGIRDDNRLENLQLINDLGHKQLIIMENRIRKLEDRVTLLKAENAILRRELKQYEV